MDPERIGVDPACDTFGYDPTFNEESIMTVVFRWFFYVYDNSVMAFILWCVSNIYGGLDDRDVRDVQLMSMMTSVATGM